MAPRIGSIDGASGIGRARRKRRGASAEAAAVAPPPEEARAASGAGSIPPADPAPAVSAQVMGQSDSAEDAPPANSAARQARGAYLKVEWSGRYDRRTRSGRIAKTDV
jgi:hypothetical protein